VQPAYTRHHAFAVAIGGARAIEARLENRNVTRLRRNGEQLAIWTGKL
jgi:hypothetical protein